LNNISLKKKNLHRFCAHGILTTFTETTPIRIRQDKENQPTQKRHGHPGTRGNCKTTYTFLTHSTMSAKQSKVAATYSGAGIRAEAKKSKVVFKNVLDTPFNVPW
jgi:hypothetical protein